MKKITLTLLLVMTMIIAATANCFAAQVMLFDDVDGVGKGGETVEVDDQTADNLIKQGLAMKVVGEVGPGGENPSAKLKDQLEGQTVVVTVTKKSFKVTAQMVAEAINNEFGTSFTGSDLSISAKTKTGTYNFTVKIDTETKANMKVTIKRNTSGTAVFEGNTIVIGVIALAVICIVVALLKKRKKVRDRV